MSNNTEKIYIGFSKNKSSLLSKIIQFAENTNYSHIYIRRSSKYGEYVYQASGLTVNFTNIETFKSKNTIVEEYEFEIDELQKNLLLAFSIKYCGRPYSIKQLFQIVKIMILNKLGLTCNIKGDGEDSFICSELGALLCSSVLNIAIPEDKDFITPRQLHSYIIAHQKMA